MNVSECFVLLFIPILTLCQTLEFSSDHFNYSTFIDVTITLHRDVKFMTERFEQVNSDAVFGLTLAQANLAVALSSQNAKYILKNEWDNISKTHEMCNNLRVHRMKNFLQRRNNPFGLLMKVLTNPEIWKKEILWRNGVLHHVVVPNRNYTIDELSSLIFSGTPRELESDRCLLELINDNCEVSDNCSDMLLRNDRSRGYAITHRLLFLKIASAINCRENPRINFPVLSETYCHIILQDLLELNSINFPPISRDLAMEQIVLCGMEGYLEFINAYYANRIISWQNSYGCYSPFNINQRKRKIRRKKSIYPMDYGCESHTSGVAAATLSLLIREYVENHLSPTHSTNDHN